MSARHAGDSSGAGLDDLFPGGLPSSVPAPVSGRARRLSRFPRLVLWSAVAGAVVAALAIPAVLPPSFAARQAVYAWRKRTASSSTSADGASTERARMTGNRWLSS